MLSGIEKIVLLESGYNKTQNDLKGEIGCFLLVKNYGSLTLAIKEKRCEASKMAYFFVNFFFFFLSNV